MNQPEPIYDVNINGYGTGFDLTLAEALSHAKVHGGTVQVSHDDGNTWNSYNPNA